MFVRLLFGLIVICSAPAFGSTYFTGKSTEPFSIKEMSNIFRKEKKFLSMKEQPGIRIKSIKSKSRGKLDLCSVCYWDYENVEVGETLELEGYYHSGGYVVVFGTGFDAGSSDFNLVSSACDNITMGPSNSCTFEFTFTPSSPGTKLSAIFLPADKYDQYDNSYQGDATSSIYLTGVSAERKPEEDCLACGSVISIDRMALMERIPIVGTEFSLVYSSEYSADYISDYNNLGTKSFFNPEAWTVSVHHYYDSDQRKIYRGDGLSDFARYFAISGGNLFVVSKDGKEAYIFSSTGKHLSTVSTLTGALIREFRYDGTYDRLIEMEDAFGNITLFNRNGSGILTDIQSPYGQVTNITVSSNLITNVENPASEEHVMTYKSSTTLLETFEKPGGQTTSFDYDANGRLIGEDGHGSNSWTLTQDLMSPGKPITLTSELGRETVVAVDKANGYARSQTLPDGNVLVNGREGLFVLDHDNKSGTLTERVLDERYGNLFERPFTVTTGHSSVNSVETFDQVVVNTSGTPDAFNYDTITQTRTVNGRVHTRVFDASTKEWTSTSAEGATTVLELNANEQPVSFKMGNDTAWTYSYDANGRLEELTQGSKNTQTLVYNGSGNISSITNVRSEQTSFTYDAANRLASVTLPDSRVIAYSYDANGNLTSVTPPSRPAHNFTYNLFETVDQYQPPSIGLGINKNTTYTYNDDKQLTGISRPDGQSVTFTYDNVKGVLNSITTPGGDYDYTYSNVTQHLTRVDSPSGLRNDLTYYGALLESDSQKRLSDGYLYGKVTFAFDGDHRLSSRTIQGNSSGTTYTRSVTMNDDDDPLAIGDLGLTYEFPSGRLSTRTLGNISDYRTYDAYGQLESYEAIYTPSSGPAVTLYEYTLTRDNGSRISSKTETIGGVTKTYDYTYDSAGRLTEEEVNTTSNTTFTYDSNSNRTGGTIDGVSFSATYDDQDRMETFNSRTYTYSNNGDLTRIDWNITDYSTFTYDVMGNLESVRLPTGTVLDYQHDGFDRRSAKESASTFQWRYLYENKYRIAATLNSSAVIQKEFVFGTRINTPDYMIVGSDKYLVITDHLGSPRLIVKSDDGTIAQRLDYNVIGDVTNDTSPGFQPYGYAGGIYDPDTGLVRFGARDYDPKSGGRWTTKDPIRFIGSDVNLYGYVLNDPINYKDFLGTTRSDLDDDDDFERTRFDDIQEYLKTLKESCAEKYNVARKKIEEHLREAVDAIKGFKRESANDPEK